MGLSQCNCQERLERSEVSHAIGWGIEHWSLQIWFHSYNMYIYNHTPMLNPTGNPYPQTPAQPVPLPAKNPYPFKGYRLDGATPGLPLSFSSDNCCLCKCPQLDHIFTIMQATTSHDFTTGHSEHPVGTRPQIEVFTITSKDAEILNGNIDEFHQSDTQVRNTILKKAMGDIYREHQGNCQFDKKEVKKVCTAATHNSCMNCWCDECLRKSGSGSTITLVQLLDEKSDSSTSGQQGTCFIMIRKTVSDCLLRKCLELLWALKDTSAHCRMLPLISGRNCLWRINKNMTPCMSKKSKNIGHCLMLSQRWVFNPFYSRITANRSRPWPHTTQNPVMKNSILMKIMVTHQMKMNIQMICLCMMLPISNQPVAHTDPLISPTSSLTMKKLKITMLAQYACEHVFLITVLSILHGINRNKVLQNVPNYFYQKSIRNLNLCHHLIVYTPQNITRKS